MEDCYGDSAPSEIRTETKGFDGKVISIQSIIGVRKRYWICQSPSLTKQSLRAWNILVFGQNLDCNVSVRFSDQNTGEPHSILDFKIISRSSSIFDGLM
ncbi:hypothetical protein AMTR_s00172p00042180 [Amborella trichopoda]|uniref:Uncharacterized protein n=1 Tax=Amborella trichopoda TaxID=13333 RepID=W1PZ63_AMBTC|nr:hypothetical protein AMTR_s00172p00042180 [Amborella trichopoda]